MLRSSQPKLLLNELANKGKTRLLYSPSTRPALELYHFNIKQSINKTINKTERFVNFIAIKLHRTCYFRPIEHKTHIWV